MVDHRVLIVSTNPAASNGLLERFRDTGCRVVAAASSDEAIQKVRSLFPEIVIVDADSEKINPFEISWQVRANVDPTRCPIFFVSCCVDHSNCEVDDRCPTDSQASCFQDVVTRVTSYFTRPTSKAADVVVCHELKIDRGRHRVIMDGHDVQLTPTEFRMLWEFAKSSGYVLSRAELSKTCLSPNASAHVRTIDVHIKTLRQKLGKHSHLIETVRGVGYRMAEQRMYATSAPDK